jgi:hypothetical protein
MCFIFALGIDRLVASPRCMARLLIKRLYACNPQRVSPSQPPELSALYIPVVFDAPNPLLVVLLVAPNPPPPPKPPVVLAPPVPPNMLPPAAGAGEPKPGLLWDCPNGLLVLPAPKPPVVAAPPKPPAVEVLPPKREPPEVLAVLLLLLVPNPPKVEPVLPLPNPKDMIAF